MIREEFSESEIAFTQLAEMPITHYNKSQLLVDGDETFSSIFDGIDSAEAYVLVEFFIVKDDRLGRELKSRLIRKARQNVKVYFLYDEIGSYKLPQSYIREMQGAGIVTSAFPSCSAVFFIFRSVIFSMEKSLYMDSTAIFSALLSWGEKTRT